VEVVNAYLAQGAWWEFYGLYYMIL
jgi:hypothetical protein